MIILACILIFIIIFLCLLRNEKSQKNCKDKIIKILIRQAARWAIAAMQDENAMITVLHANYAAGYLWALRDIATDNEILKSTGVDILRFRDEIVKVQDGATIKMARACPNFVPSPSYLTQISRLTK